jgi:hypothetical protein
MAFWEPGMPAKGFDPFNIDRVKADLEDGSCLEFPFEDYYEYLIQITYYQYLTTNEQPINILVSLSTFVPPPY